MATSGAPTGEKGGIGQVLPSFPNTPGYGRFIQEDESVDELRWPQSVTWYERMLYSDSQLEALYLGTMMPLWQYHWALDPNGADTGWTELLAEDLGLPVGLPDDDEAEQDILPGAYSFSFLDHLQEATLGVPLGHYFFERVGEIDDQLRWRLRKLGPLAPATIEEIGMSPQGELGFVRQRSGVNITTRGPTMFFNLPEPIDADRICTYVWRGDARARWIGRPMLRTAYRHWLVKDMLIRVDAINHEKAGGVPTIETDETFQGTNLDELQALAASWRVGEDSGAALPPGAKMVLKAIQTGNVVASMEYHDNLMARAWQSMVMQLGQGGAPGNRALGQTMAGVQDSAQQAIAKWVRGNFNLGVIRAWWANNVPVGSSGALPPHPLLVCRPRNSAVAQVPPSQEAPPGPPPVAVAEGTPSPPAQGVEATRDRGAEVESVAHPSAGEATHGSGNGRAGGEGEAQAPGRRQHALPLKGAASLPDRPLRRQPYAHEIQAATDFAGIETLHAQTTADAVALFEDEWLPNLTEQVRAGLVSLGDSPTAAQVADLRLIPPDPEPLHKILHAIATRAADDAGAELAAQGVTVGVADAERIEALIAGQAEAMAQQITDGITLASTRKAVQLSNPAVPVKAEELAAGVVDYLGGLAHAWEERQIGGAVHQAHTAGRFARFDLIEDTARYYASSLLDAQACEPCIDDDGLEFGTLEEAMAWAPAGGNPSCEGGPSCRCTVVAVAGSEI